MKGQVRESSPTEGTAGPPSKEIYYEFGRAAEMAQVMETEAGNLAVTYATGFVDHSSITYEQREFIRALLQDVNKRTLGNLVGEIRKQAQMDDSIIDTLNLALEKRNYLTHHFFRTHNLAFHSVEGRRIMLAELREIHGIFVSAHALLSAMTGSLNELFSIVFGLNVLSEKEALALVAEGKRLDI